MICCIDVDIRTNVCKASVTHLRIVSCLVFDTQSGTSAPIQAPFLLPSSPGGEVLEGAATVNNRPMESF
jgi:hypothetical protein